MNNNGSIEQQVEKPFYTSGRFWLSMAWFVSMDTLMLLRPAQSEHVVALAGIGSFVVVGAGVTKAWQTRKLAEVKQTEIDAQPQGPPA